MKKYIFLKIIQSFTPIVIVDSIKIEDVIKNT